MLDNSSPELNLSRDFAPPFKIGEMVSVISLVGNVAFIEGLAVVKGIAKGRHRYQVLFIGDTRLRERVVHHVYQRLPEDTVSWLAALLHEPSEERLDDFFPDDL